MCRGRDSTSLQLGLSDVQVKTEIGSESSSSVFVSSSTIKPCNSNLEVKVSENESFTNAGQ